MKRETRLAPTRGALTVRDAAEMVPLANDQTVPSANAEIVVAVPNADLTAQVIAALDYIASVIPDLRAPHPKTAKRVRGARTVSREAVMSIIAMVEASPSLQRVKTLDTMRAKEVVYSMDSFRLISERLENLRARVGFTAEAQWAEVVADAMNTYQLATVFAKDPQEAELTPHLATIQRHLGRRNAATGKRGKAKGGEGE